VHAPALAAAGAVALGGHRVQVAGEQHGRAGGAGQHAGVPEVAHGGAGGAQDAEDVVHDLRLAAGLRGDVDQLEGAGGETLAELGIGHGAPP
jgi:hypothetical protein